MGKINHGQRLTVPTHTIYYLRVNIRPAPHLHSFGPAHIAIVCDAVPTKRIWGTGQTFTVPSRIFTLAISKNERNKDF